MKVAELPSLDKPRDRVEAPMTLAPARCNQVQHWCLMPELVIFELVGTLVYDQGAIARFLTAACLRAGIAASLDDVESRWNFGHNIRSILTIIALPRIASLDSDRPISSIVQGIEEDFKARIQHHLRTSSEAREIPGATRALQTLHEAGVRVVLGSRLDLETCHCLMERFGWHQNHLVGDVLSLADENDILEDSFLPAFPARTGWPLGMRETQIAKVCATPLGVTSGRAASCKWVIATLFNAQDETEFQPHHPTHTISRLEDLAGVLFERSQNCFHECKA